MSEEMKKETTAEEIKEDQAEETAAKETEETKEQEAACDCLLYTSGEAVNNIGLLLER